MSCCAGCQESPAASFRARGDGAWGGLPKPRYQPPASLPRGNKGLGKTCKTAPDRAPQWPRRADKRAKPHPTLQAAQGGPRPVFGDSGHSSPPGPVSPSGLNHPAEGQRKVRRKNSYRPVGIRTPAVVPVPAGGFPTGAPGNLNPSPVAPPNEQAARGGTVDQSGLASTAGQSVPHALPPVIPHPQGRAPVSQLAGQVAKKRRRKRKPRATAGEPVQSLKAV